MRKGCDTPVTLKGEIHGEEEKNEIVRLDVADWRTAGCIPRIDFLRIKECEG